MDIHNGLEIVVLLIAIVGSGGTVLWKLARVSVKVERLLEFFDGRECGEHALRLDDHERRIVKLEE